METTILYTDTNGGSWCARDNGIFALNSSKRYEIIYIPENGSTRSIEYLTEAEYEALLKNPDSIRLHPSFIKSGGTLPEVEVTAKKTTNNLKKKWWVYIGLAALAVVVITISLTVVMKRKKRRK